MSWQFRARTPLPGELTTKTLLRFFSKIKKLDQGCWIWLGVKSREGYGVFRIKRKNIYAHRVSFVASGKDLSEHLTLDHLCRNHPCVNPAHLEPVPLRENILRGVNPWAINARKETCKNGHSFDTKNTLFNEYGFRHCASCIREGKRKDSRLYRIRHLSEVRAQQRRRKREIYRKNRDEILAKNRERAEERRRQGLPVNSPEKLEYAKQYRERHRARILAEKKIYRAKNLDKINQREKTYWLANRNKILSRSRAYYQKNREKVLEYKRDYQLKNRERLIAYQRRHRQKLRAEREPL